MMASLSNIQKYLFLQHTEVTKYFNYEGVKVIDILNQEFQLLLGHPLASVYRYSVCPRSYHQLSLAAVAEAYITDFICTMQHQIVSPFFLLLVVFFIQLHFFLGCPFVGPQNVVALTNRVFFLDLLYCCWMLKIIKQKIGVLFCCYT